MLADDHTGIDARAGIDEHRPTVLQIEERIGNGNAFGIREKHACVTHWNFAQMGRIGMKQTVHDCGATGIG